MKYFYLSACIIFLFACGTQRHASHSFFDSKFQATDFTQENLFTNNIEGPAFYHDSLFVVNFQRDGTIALVHPDGTCELYLNLPKGSIANSIKFDSKGNMLLADFAGHNILKVDKRHYVTTYCHAAFNQPNDICINHKDQLFASDPNWANNTGQIWRIDTPGVAVLLAHNMGTTNGIELSPDEKILYVNESVQRKIWRYDVDSTGNISDKQLFTQFLDYGLDGMHCDKEGNLYVCRYGKGTIAVFTPQGNLIHEIPLKGKDCSNLVFGGEDGRTVFVTLQDRKCMEMFRTDIPGKNF